MSVIENESGHGVEARGRCFAGVASQATVAGQHILTAVFVVLLVPGCGDGVSVRSGAGNLTQYVDPMIGTDASGHTFPGATLPFGMVQLSPSNDYKAWDWSSGYHYSDTVLKGFAHTHISGPGLAALGDILLMPASTPNTNPGTEENPESGYRSRFSHDRERAEAGYYSVHLDDEDIDVELTATSRVGFHRYTYNNSGASRYVIIDPGHNIAEPVYETSLEIVSDTIVRGYKKARSGTAGDRTMYFVAEFSAPFASLGLTDDDRPVAGRRHTARTVRGYVSFAPESGPTITVKVALSGVGYDGAQMNFEKEARHVDFDTARASAKTEWQDVLEKIVIEDASESKKRTFYTGMYHAFIGPNLISDVDGQYYLEGKVRQSAIPQYSNFSTWDTYRALHPLLTIIEQEQTAELIASMVSRHADEGLGLPGWEAMGFDNVCMIGYNMTSPIADAILKDVPGIDADKAYRAIRAAAFDKTKHSPNYDVNGMEEYLTYGYVTGEVGSSVSKTTEQNYFDWAIARVAEKLGKTDDAALFDRRSTGYRNLFNPDKAYLWPRLSRGGWKDMDDGQWTDLRANYVSGNIWAYSAYTPHDMKGAIQLHGGRKAYARWLDSVFNDERPIEGHQHVDISGFIGRYGHGDEPGHHMPYLFNYVGEPWKTQKYVNTVLTTMYSDKPDGLINNEDLGQMSAWYIFSSIGFYPVAPGDLVYQLGAPLHDRATINLESGKTFEVVANNLSPENIYVQGVSLNGAPHEFSFIEHRTIMAGGVLTFEMGPEPNETWASLPAQTVLGEFDDTERPQMGRGATLAPYDENAEGFFANRHEVVLRTNDSNAEIYYTTDGSMPDKDATQYVQPFDVTEDTVLRAIAYREGLAPSRVSEKTVFRSVVPTLADGYPLVLSPDEETPYGLADHSMLFDQQIGSTTYSDGRWTGRKVLIRPLLDLGRPVALSAVTVGALTDTTTWIFPPKKVEVFGGDTPDNLALLATHELPEVTQNRKAVDRFDIRISDGPHRYYRIVVTPYGRIPSWHGGQDLAWVFVDEIILR